MNIVPMSPKVEQSLAGMFLWRTHSGDTLEVREMHTSHLVNTVRMIWNHCAPYNLRLEPYKRWDLSSLSADYQKDAVRAMVIELRNRDDLTWQQLVTINHMIGAFSSVGIRKLNS